MNLEQVNLLDESAFAWGSGLWIGKREPLVAANVIRNTNFTASGRIDYSNVAVLKVEEKQLASRRLLPGDIVVERSGGGPAQPVGRVVFFEREDGTFSHSNFTSRLRVVDITRFEPRFVFYFLLYFYDSGQTDHLQRRTTGIRNLDWRAYRKSAVVPHFNLNEQRQIAALLSAVQLAIDRQERLIALTAELKRAVMQKLFTEGTRGDPLKQTEIGSVPQSWNVDRLDRAGDVIYGIQAAVANNIKPVGTRILTNKNIDLTGNIVVDKQSYFQLKTEKHRKTLLKKGDILFNWRSGSKEHVGKTAYFDLEGEWTHSSFILRIRPREEVNGRFLFHYLTWLRESKYFVKLHNYAVNAKFNKSAINALPIVLPDRLEQTEIADALDVVINKVNVHISQLAALNRLFHDLLHQLMTVQIRVRDLDLSALEEAEQEPAGAM
jgi:type I restriction enzyme S subunit